MPCAAGRRRPAPPWTRYWGALRTVAEAPSFEVSGRLVRVARVRNEWFADIAEPGAVIDDIRKGHLGRVDLLTFWQRLPVREPMVDYYWEPEFVAALPVTTYETWWKQQIDGKTRNLVRKGEKKGLVVRVVPFDDGLVEGITKIFNETPVRQGRRFWHYGKNCDQVRAEMADRPECSLFIGAYVEKELVGFVKLLVLDEYAMMVEIISEVRHRDRAPNNALVAAAVKECASRHVPFLTYSTWGSASLAAFKESNGFEKVSLPRYYVPLTPRGTAILRLKLHRGISARLPETLKEKARAARRGWHAWFNEGFVARSLSK